MADRPTPAPDSKKGSFKSHCFLPTVSDRTPSRSPSADHYSKMAEPPAKRAKRTDSSAMWDRNDTKSSSERRGDRGGHDEGKKRHDDRRRDRSRSRDRSMRDRHRSRRDDHPPRSDRHRSRSRSPKRNRSRSRSPKRNNTRTRSPPRKPQADRSKEPLKSSTNNSTPKSNATPTQPSSRPPTTSSTNGTTKGDTEKMDVVDDDEDGEAAAEREMQKIMGFGKFRSTKNTKVPGNDIYAVRKEKKTEYRQYMNRVGGFNRPLSPSRD